MLAREELFNPDGRNLYVIFMPWHAGEVPFIQLCKRFARCGDTVAGYWLPDNIISADANTTVEMYEQAQKVISDRLRALTAKHNYAKVHLVGMSLGNVALSLVANEFRDFDNATMICTASSLAKSLWHGARTQDIKETFIENGVDLTNLESIWHTIEPINNIGALVDKDVKIVVANKDTHIPTKYQREYVGAIQQPEVTNLLKVKSSRFGHYGAIIKYCILGR